MTTESLRITRRGIIGAALLATIAPRRLSATEAEMRAAIRERIGEAKPQLGRVRLDLPPLAESGNSVPVGVSVESRMDAQDHVRRIMIFSERNPRPHIITVWPGPDSGRAEFTTRMRLSGTQSVLAIAELSDGSFWLDQVNIMVTIGACDSLMFRY